MLVGERIASFQMGVRFARIFGVQKICAFKRFIESAEILCSLL